MGLKLYIKPMRFMAIRAAGYDPIKAQEIEERLTLAEIAEVIAVRTLDHYTEED